MVSRHLETVCAACGGGAEVAYQRHVVPTPDGDEIALDSVAGKAGKPFVVIFHGLEGSSQSNSVRRIAAHFSACGWGVAVPHFRTCGGRMNKLPRAYHAADDEEIDWMLRHCAGMFEKQTPFAIGVSLGGNALINWAAKRENENKARAIATVSAPFDLAQSVRAIDGGINRLLYARHFLKTLRAKVLQKQKRYPGLCAEEKISRARTLADFDEWYTAPVHRFASAAEYWQKGSCGDSLRYVTTPLLCINALNDPLVPVSCLPKDAPENVTFIRPRTGGHAGFTGTPENWLAQTLERFFIRAMN